MRNLKGIGGQRWKCSEETKVVTLKVKFESDLNGVIGEIADRWNIDLSAIWVSRYAMWPEKVVEGDLPA